MFGKKFIYLLMVGFPLLSTPLNAADRIVSMNLCTDELLLSFVEPSAIASVTVFSGNKNSSAIYDRVKTIPKNKGEIEQVLSFDPTLVVGGTFSNQETMNALKRLGVPTLMLQVADNFGEVVENIRILAKATNRQKDGDAAIASLQQRLEELRREIPDQKRVAAFYQSGGKVPGEGTFQDEVLYYAGLENLAKSLEMKGFGDLDLEELITHKPEVLIFLDTHRSRGSLGRELLFHPAMKQALADVQQMTVASKYLNCGSPYLIKSIEEIRSKLNEDSL